MEHCHPKVELNQPLQESSCAMICPSAVLDRKKLGLGLTVFVEVKVDGHSDRTAKAISDKVTAAPDLIAGGRRAGRPGSTPHPEWTAIPPDRALRPGRYRGTAASPGR